jgi:hypothetical protein
MRYLVAVFADEKPPENRCADSEPVIPAFPMGDSNHFIGVFCSGVSTYASARNMPDDVDPDEILKKLVETYPGIPKAYLEDTLTRTMVVAARLDTISVYRVFVTEDSAVLHNVDNENELIPLWKDRPASKYL